MSDDRYTTIASIAARIESSTKTAQRILTAAGVPIFRIGGQIRFRAADIDAYFESQKIEPSVPEVSLKTLVHAAVERAKKRRAS